MANIIDPTAVAFSNAKIRPIADKFMKLYWFAKATSSEWTAKNMSALIPNDSSLVVDGSAVDGRTPITGGDINILLAHLNTFIADLEATTNLKRNQINKVAVNPLP